MLHRKKWLYIGFLILLCIAINIYSSKATRVETGYATMFYPTLSAILRRIFGWLPISLGDIFYGVIVVYFFIKIFKLIRYLFSKNKATPLKQQVELVIFKSLKLACIIYIVFNIFWGLNYNRVGIANQLGLKIDKYSVEDLKNINQLLIDKMNACKTVIIKNQKAYPTNKGLFDAVENAYASAAKKYPYLVYKNASIKQSLWGWLGNYVGFEGYYNPFTGEAQVNTTVPKFTLPFTACHEVAHQLGYAKEMEANFVGYLAATASNDTMFKYSVYAEMFLYANRTLFFADTTAAVQYKKMLQPAIILDFKERRKFYAAHRSFVEPAISYLYGKFLQSNQQPLGILSYDEVTAFVIAYYKKYGGI